MKKILVAHEHHGTTSVIDLSDMPKKIYDITMRATPYYYAVPPSLNTADEDTLILEDGKVIVSEYAAKEKRNNRAIESRRAEYPAVTDQLDAIMKWLATETEFGIPAELKSLACKCMSVKAKYQKED